MKVPRTQRTVFLLGPERLELREVPVPEPSEGEVLLRVDAATTCGTDLKVFLRGGHPRMLQVPCPFGHELCGTVVAAGPGVSRAALGDRVVVANSAPCGRCEYCAEGRENLCTDLAYLNGAFSEYLLVPRRFVERNLHRVPDGLPAEVAALAEPLACVVHGVEACELRGPSDVAVYGAGPIGLLFIGLLSSLGHRAVAADTSPERLRAARDLGAAETVEISAGPGQSAKVRAFARKPGGFDVAIDATGTPEGWTCAVESARPGGIANLFGGCAPGTRVALDSHLVHYSELTIKGVYHHRPDTFARAIEILASGAFDARRLLSFEVPLERLEDALRSMHRREALKVVVRPKLAAGVTAGSCSGRPELLSHTEGQRTREASP